MKYLCLGFFQPEKMAGYAPADLDALMARCRPFMDELAASGHLVLDVGVEPHGRLMRRAGGQVTDGPFMETKELVGGIFIVEADDLPAAMEIAKLHPVTRMPEAEALGWRMEIRPIHFYREGR